MDELGDPDVAAHHRLCWSQNHHHWSSDNSPPITRPTSSISLPSPIVSTPNAASASVSADGSSSSFVLVRGFRSHSSPSALMGPRDVTDSGTTPGKGSSSVGGIHGADPEPGCHNHRLRTAISLDPDGLPEASLKTINGPPSPTSDNAPSATNDLMDTAPPPPPPPPPPPLGRSLPFLPPSKAEEASSLTPMKTDVCSPRSSAGPGARHGFDNSSLGGLMPTPMTDYDMTAEAEAGTGITTSTSLPSESPREATGQSLMRAYSSTIPGPCSFPGGPATPWQLEGAQHRRRHNQTATALCSSIGSLGNQQSHQGTTAIISCDDSKFLTSGDEAALETSADLSDGGFNGASWHLPSGLIGTPQPSPPSQSRRLMPHGTSRCTAAMTNLQQRLNFDNDEMVEQKSEAASDSRSPHGTVVVTPVPSMAAASKAGDGRGDMTAAPAAMGPLMRMRSSPCPSSTVATPSAAVKSCWDNEQGGWSNPPASLPPTLSGSCRSLSLPWPLGPGAVIINDDWFVQQQQQQQQPCHNSHCHQAPAEAPHQGFGLERVHHPHSGSSHANTTEAASMDLASAGSSPETVALSAAASGGNMAPLMMSMPIMVPGSSGTTHSSGSGGNSCFEGTVSTQFLLPPHFSSAFPVDNPGGPCVSKPQQPPHLLQHGYAPQQQRQQQQQQRQRQQPCSLAPPMTSLPMASLPPPPPPLQQEQSQQHLPAAAHRRTTSNPHLPVFPDGYSGSGPHQALLPGMIPSGQQFQMPLMMPGYQQHQIGAAQQQSAPQWPSQMPQGHGGGGARALVHSQVLNNSFPAYQQQPKNFSSGIGLRAMAAPAPPLTAASNAAGSALPHQYISHNHHQATDMLQQQMNQQFQHQLHHQMQHLSPSIDRGSQSCGIGKAVPAASAISQQQQQHGCDQLSVMMPASAGFPATSTTAMPPHPSSVYLKPIANKVDVRKWMDSNLP